MFHCAANCTTLGAERQLTAVGGGYFTTAGYLPDRVDRTDRGRSCLPFFAKTFQIFAKKGLFSEKLQKNHKKIAIFAVFGVDFAKGIEYNTLGILCKMQFLRTNPTVLQ